MLPRLQKPRRRHQGFSLVEVLVVIFIAAILVAITVGAVSAMNKMNGKQQTLAMITAFDAALDEYKNSTGEYPRISMSLYSTPSVMNPTNYTTFAEATFMNQALDHLSPNRLNANAGQDANNSLISLLKPNTVTYTSAITVALSEFRTGTTFGGRTTSTTATLSAATAEAARTYNGGTSITFVRDAWDRYIVYFPSYTSSDQATGPGYASRLRPMFASAGPDGILESVPWRLNAFPSSMSASDPNMPPAIVGSIAYAVDARVYYKQRWYRCISAYTSTDSSLPPPQDTARWVEYASDDIITRGDWR